MSGPRSSAPSEPDARGSVHIHAADNLEVMRSLPTGSFTLAYLDPPFNTGRIRHRAIETAHSPSTTPATSQGTAERSAQLRGSSAEEASRCRSYEPVGSDTGHDDTASTDTASTDTASGGTAPAPTVRRGFHGREYERLRGDLRAYDDRFDDYWGFLEPRLTETWRLLAAEGTLYLHLDYREAHYAKVLMDALFGRDHFLNELIWAYDYGAKSRRRWPTKHDTILVYVKDPSQYWFDSDAVDREPYMAPGLVTPEKARRGKLPTDVWWHTIVPTAGREKTGYPTQKPEGVLRRIVAASTRVGDAVLDPFAGSGTTGAVASALGRRAVLIDDNPDAVGVMTQRIPHAVLIDDNPDAVGVMTQRMPHALLVDDPDARAG